MSWAKEAAEAIVDDELSLESEEAARRKKRILVAAATIAGLAGAGALAYANREAISAKVNKAADLMFGKTGPGIAEKAVDVVLSPQAAAGGALAAATSSKTLGRMRGLGPLLGHKDVGLSKLQERLQAGEAGLKPPEKRSLGLTANDTAAPLREALAATGVKPAQLGTVISKFRESPETSHLAKLVPADVTRRWWESSDSAQQRQAIAAMEAAGASPRNPAARELGKALGGAKPEAIRQLATQLKAHYHAPGRSATVGRVLGSLAAPHLIPAAWNTFKGTFLND